MLALAACVHRGSPVPLKAPVVSASSVRLQTPLTICFPYDARPAIEKRGYRPSYRAVILGYMSFRGSLITRDTMIKAPDVRPEGASNASAALAAILAQGFSVSGLFPAIALLLEVCPAAPPETPAPPATLWSRLDNGFGAYYKAEEAVMADSTGQAAIMSLPSFGYSRLSFSFCPGAGACRQTTVAASATKTGIGYDLSATLTDVAAKVVQQVEVWSAGVASP